MAHRQHTRESMRNPMRIHGKIHSTLENTQHTGKFIAERKIHENPWF